MSSMSPNRCAQTIGSLVLWSSISAFAPACSTSPEPQQPKTAAAVKPLPVQFTPVGLEAASQASMRLHASARGTRFPELTKVSDLKLRLAAGISGVTHLDLSGYKYGADLGDAIAGITHSERLVALDLSDNAMGPSGVERLLSAPFISHLEHLDLGGNNLGSEGYSILARSKKLGKVRALFLNANAIDANALAEPNDVAWLASLDVLDLTMNPLGVEGALALSEMRPDPQWMALFLLGCGIGPKGASVLAQGPAWPRLVVLSLGGNAIGDVGVSDLARSNRFPHLITLDLAANSITDEGAAALAEQYNRRNQLAAIDLIGNLFTDEGRESLINRFGSHVRF